jgi:hypothetical protein
MFTNGCDRRKQTCRQRGVIQPAWQRPGQSCSFSCMGIFGNDADRQFQVGGNLPTTQIGFVFEAQYGNRQLRFFVAENGRAVSDPTRFNLPGFETRVRLYRLIHLAVAGR